MIKIVELRYVLEIYFESQEEASKFRKLPRGYLRKKWWLQKQVLEKELENKKYFVRIAQPQPFKNKTL